MPSERLRAAKYAYTTRIVQPKDISTLVTGGVTPRSGDLVLAHVDEIGHHKALSLRDGRRSHLFVGDEVVVCYGNRYATDQFEALVPTDLLSCHLVAAGGLAGRVVSWHDDMEPPTTITPIGLLGNGRRPLNLSRFGRKPLNPSTKRPSTVAVLGTSMNSGKTTAAAYLVRGLANAGLRVGAAKITGTGAPGDPSLFQDAGADPVLDFTDAGFASTYLASPGHIRRIVGTLTSHIAATGVGAMVLEIADGLFQQETAELVTTGWFARAIDGIVFCGGEAMAASAGVEFLRRRGLRVVAVSGRLSRSELGIREAHAATALPVLDLAALQDPHRVLELIAPSRQTIPA
jgi:hypothetical protein